MMKTEKYKEIPFSIERKMTEDATRIGMKIPFIHSCWEVDVHDIRIKIRKIRKEQKSTLSLSTYLMYCFVFTINANKNLHGMKSWKNTIFQFEDIDVLFPIELQNKVLSPKIIRSANRKSIFELEDEIQQTRAKQDSKIDFYRRCFLRLPRVFRDFYYHQLVMKNPKLRKDSLGTVYFTSGNINSTTKAHGIPIPMHSIGMFLGSTENKLVEFNGEIVKRNHVAITNSADHRIVDGAVLARFMVELKRNIETLIDSDL